MVDLVVGVCRNDGVTVAKTFSKVSLHPAFEQSSWLVVESNSSDDTVDVLKELTERNANFSFLSLGADDSLVSRVNKIRRARNAYVEEIRRQVPERVAVIDFDSELLRYLSIPSDLVHLAPNEIVSARQKWIYYDIEAFRPKSYDLEVPFMARPKFLSSKLSWLYYVVPKQIVLTFRSLRKFEVSSAFGGLTLYPGRLFLQADYGPVTKANTECEHVFLHSVAKQQGYKIFIDPTLEYGRINEHAFPLVFARLVSSTFANIYKKVFCRKKGLD